MKKIFFLLALMVASLTSYATTYVLYGNATNGTTDLTNKVTAAAQGTATFENGVFTGAGLPGRICESNNYLQMSFTDAQTLTLTDKYALHIVLSKAEGATGDVQVSFCKNGWNAARTAWTINNADIESGTATDITLRYADCNTGNWNSYAQETFIGTVEYPANEILRICGANGEQFTISQIYLVSEEESTVEPEPEPEPTPDGIYRYYLYRGNNTDALPVIEDVTCIDVRPTANAGVACNTATQDTEITDYTQFTVTGSWCAIDHKPATSVTNAIDDTYYLVVRFKSNLGDGAFRSNQMRFNLSNGAQNFNINNTDNETYNDEKWHTVILALKDASGNKPATYLTANQIAFQIHLNGNGESGKYIAIDYAYFTNDISALDEGTVEDGFVPEPEPEEIPEQAAQRIYLKKGTAVTPEGVLETADYTEGAYLTSEWWNCSVSNDFFGITTNQEWWFNFQLKNNQAVDLTPVYSTWRLVISLKNTVVEEGTDRGLTIELGAPAANLELTSTYAEATDFVVKELPLTESLTGAKHLGNITIGANILVMSSNNNNEPGRTIEFDYIYFTNETEDPDNSEDGPTTAVENIHSTKAEKFIQNGQMFIRRGEHVYSVMGTVVE